MLLSDDEADEQNTATDERVDDVISFIIEEVANELNNIGDSSSDEQHSLTTKSLHDEANIQPRDHQMKILAP